MQDHEGNLIWSAPHDPKKNHTARQMICSLPNIIYAPLLVYCHFHVAYSIYMWTIASTLFDVLRGNPENWAADSSIFFYGLIFNIRTIPSFITPSKEHCIHRKLIKDRSPSTSLLIHSSKGGIHDWEMIALHPWLWPRYLNHLWNNQLFNSCFLIHLNFQLSVIKAENAPTRSCPAYISGGARDSLLLLS